MELRKHNPVKWRENELVLVTMYCLLGIAGAWWKIFEHTGAELRDMFGGEFRDHHLYFDFFVNYLLPETGLFTALYLCYFWMNLYILPRLTQTDAAERGSFRVAFSLRGRIDVSGNAGKTLIRFVWGVIHAILLILVLGAIWGGVIYYQHEYEFKGWEWVSTANRMLGLGWRNAAGLVILFTAYGMFREWVIQKLLKEPGQSTLYYILLVNKIGIYTTIYFTIGCVLYFFEIVDDRSFFIVFFGVAPSLILGGVTVLYWIFPAVSKSFWERKNLRKVLVTGFCWSIPFSVWMADESRDLVPAVMSLWTGQFLVAFVLWIFYRGRREQFLRLQGLEAALGRREADLQFLKNQINPHFLFNALNTLYGTALQEEAQRTAGGIQQLGDMMRFMLHENQQDRIPMSKEVEYLKNYIDLQRLRTDSSPQIRIETEIGDLLPDCMIAPMILIPFVENAFKHGISLREASWISIRLTGEKAKILFEVRNSVHTRLGTDPEREKSGVGLKNVLHRLTLMYPGKHSFFVNQDEREFFVQLMIEP